MKKLNKNLLIFIMGFLCLSCLNGEHNKVTSSSLAPKEFKELLIVDTRGGKIVSPQDFSFTKPGHFFLEHSLVTPVFEQTYSDYGSYFFKIDIPDAGDQLRPQTSGRRELRSIDSFPIKENRQYLISVLAKTNFDRNSCEFNVYMRYVHKGGGGLTPRHTLGLPAQTSGPDGWQRLEWIVTTPVDPRIEGAKAAFDLTVKKSDQYPEVRIADYTIVELPVIPLKPLKRGEGVEFPGGVGDLPMRIESVEAGTTSIVVKTTGAKYDFNLNTNVIKASQRIEFPRELALWESSLPLKDLRVDRHTEDVCVLSNEYITIGIQSDSLLLISPQYELTMKLTNLFGGDFNRYSRGCLYSTDDFGGISVDPYVPMGTGLKPVSELLTEHLAFENLNSSVELQKQVSAKKVVVSPWNTEETGAENPGWQALWKTRPGEFFTTSVFPPRPYDWAKSFTEWSRTYHYWDNPVKDTKGLTPMPNNWVLWNHIPKMFGYSYSNEYAPLDPEKFSDLMSEAKQLGVKVLPYMSAYWTPSRDPNVFIQGVKNFKQQYDIKGIYSDGLPSADWILAYKEMRLLRELFPTGTIAIHNSSSQSGWETSQQKPFLYTYATSISMAEGETTQTGIYWIYPRYVTSQFRKSNALGRTLGGKWYEKGNGQRFFGEKSGLVTLVYNGRDNNPTRKDYVRIQQKLYQLWKEKGTEAFFYDRYFLPVAQKLTGYQIGRAGMPIETITTTGTSRMIALQSLSPKAQIFFTRDGSRPNANSELYSTPIKFENNGILKAIAISKNLEASAVLTIQLD